MKPIYKILVLVFLLSGCATVEEQKPLPAPIEVTQVESKIEKVEIDQPDPSPELENIREEDLEEYVKKNGVVFAKTDFTGVLETSYVKLFIEDLKDTKHKFQLYIGDKAGQQPFSWDVKTVQPGYFFIELPVGKYKISNVSIPVGTTQATEDIHITFDVLPETITYLGTLRIVGTKEKIRLGGVPVIKPGFEYDASILDEREEGFIIFKKRYPNIPSKMVQINLMTLNPE